MAVVHSIMETVSLQWTDSLRHRSENSQQVAEGRMQVSSLNLVTETARQIMVAGVVAAEGDFK